MMPLTLFPQPGARLQNLPLRVLAPIPLPLMQLGMTLILRRVLADRRDIFARLGESAHKRFMIDPTNLPFVSILHPHPQRPTLRAYRRGMAPQADARIAGTMLTLLDIVDGRLEGDALFFTRELVVEGDTEAVVALRNTLDDLEGSVADNIAAAFGPPGIRALTELRDLRGGHYGG